MWVRNTVVELSAIFSVSYGILYWYASQMKSNEVAVFIDEPLLYASLKSTVAILPSILCIWLYKKFIQNKSVNTLFMLSFIGSMLGMILQLVMYTKTIISTEHQIIHKPSLYVSQIFLEYWSFGGALSGVFVSAVIVYMLNMLNEGQDTD